MLVVIARRCPFFSHDKTHLSLAPSVMTPPPSPICLAAATFPA